MASALWLLHSGCNRGFPNADHTRSLHRARFVTREGNKPAPGLISPWGLSGAKRAKRAKALGGTWASVYWFPNNQCQPRPHMHWFPNYQTQPWPHMYWFLTHRHIIGPICIGSLPHIHSPGPICMGSLTHTVTDRVPDVFGNQYTEAQIPPKASARLARLACLARLAPERPPM